MQNGCANNDTGLTVAGFIVSFLCCDYSRTCRTSSIASTSEVSGTFKVLIDNAGVFDRKREGRFPETKELKQLVRDVVNPGKDLGHSERK